jgi:signal transduction histidine kinase
MASSPFHILIVDDVVHNITALEALLAGPDVKLLTAHSGTAALDLLLKNEVALAILDVNMPGMNGLELAALMRGSSRTAHVPIIFLTAAIQDTARTMRAYEVGAVDIMHKPFDPQILRSKIAIFMHLERQKRQLAEQLLATRQMLDANEMLMAVLSHDLRSPLGAVLASAEFLVRTAAEQQTSEVASRIRSSAMRMTRMVDQLLNLARLQGGRPILQPCPTELASLCKAVVEECAAREGIDRVTLSTRGDSLGNWDPDLLWQAIANLVNNALHHGAPDSEVKVEVDGEMVDCVRVKVTNRGAISPEVVPHLFKPFGSNSGRARSREGLGLGLHIVQSIARMHGGCVGVTPNTTASTIFTLVLPRDSIDRDKALARVGGMPEVPVTDYSNQGLQ